MRKRTVRDWTPDLGDGQEWLAQLESEGWVPKYGAGVREGWVPKYGAGVRVTINGRDVVRYALIEAHTHDV